MEGPRVIGSVTECVVDQQKEQWVNGLEYSHTVSNGIALTKGE